MGRPKGSKNAATKTVTRTRKEKLDIVAVNALVKNLSDMAADISLRFREQAQFIMLQRNAMIEQERKVQELTEQFVKDHGDEIMASVKKDLEIDDGQETIAETKSDPEPANLANLFGAASDPERK